MDFFERVDLADLRLFTTIVRRQSFKSAAIELGMTPSAASHAIRRLESRLGAKLLNRTSRAVAPTDLGVELASRLAEGFDVIGAALHSLKAPGAARFGELRVNAFADAAHLLIAPALPEFARQCPEVRITVVVEDRPIDIVAEGYDAGFRYGHTVPEDMVALALTGPQRWVVAASPAYLQERGTPNAIDDLAQHTCLQLLLGDNAAFRWELSDGDETVRLRVPGSITINDTATTIAVAKAGLGLAYLLEARIANEIRKGTLKVVLSDHASAGEPFHVYYDSRRHGHPALRSLVNIIRQQNGLTRLFDERSAVAHL
ncbi:LysR family transcriptional regulator [Agrobacterium sp. rho-13.3]|uniref:LysR family transcriptional regulator n=1 Tax=Agrobacterium sp. rho-13.3 TaxID=3072980 RepID=UPI002A0CBAB8|nr:LysR family transcriptional regulator [Agrobacterium sp. rho-13.3]MDX8308151.1 LysR family transcriptional regulator [Agrobacterium sp. rho-13.3]